MVDETELKEDTELNEAEEAAIRAEAKALGYVSEDEWDDERAEKEGRRKPSHFITAREFIERTKNSLPILRERLQHMEIINTEMAGKLNDMHTVVMEQRNMTKAAVARSYEAGKLAAEAEMREAVVEGDMEKYDNAKARVEQIEEAGAAVAAEQAKPADPRSKISPITRSWVDQNEWFSKDVTLNAAMIREHTMVKQKHPDLAEWASLELAKTKLMKRFPEEFNINPNREGGGTVSTPSGFNGSATRSNFDSLPQADRDAYERHRKMLALKKVQYTKEEFMREYAL